MTNLFGTYRFTSVRVSKIALNGLELCKPYDAFGFLLNGHHRTDCVMYTILLPLRESNARARANTQQARNGLQKILLQIP
jgi:hypothetical protein